MKENLPNPMLQLMSDGCWHPTETLLEAYPWLEREDIQACLVYPAN